MTEDEWWQRVANALLEFPHTSDNPVAMTELLDAAGYYNPRSGFERPEWHSPERYARAMWRCRYVLPDAVVAGGGT